MFSNVWSRSLSLKSSLVVALFVGCSASETPEPAKQVAPATTLHQVTAATFAAEVTQSDLPVLVEVGVNQDCARCDTMKPRVAEVVRQFDGQAKFVRVDFRGDAELAEQLGVTFCPTYLLIHEGQVVDSVVGETFTPLLTSRLAAIVDAEQSEQ